MKSDDFYIEEVDPAWNPMDLNPAGMMRTALNVALIDQLRQRPHESVDDLEAAYALTQLAHDELLAYGTGGGERLDDQELASVLRAIRAVLKRQGVDFDPPFRDFKGFHGYWSGHGMSGTDGWGARRGCLNDLFNPVFLRLEQLEDERAAHEGFRGVDGQLKNLIFASTGPKPAIVLRDAINNVIEVTHNAEYCLFYDRSVRHAGLTWGELVEWWRATAGLNGQSTIEVGRELYGRLGASVKDNPVEHLVFRTYCGRYAGEDAASLPALLPQVYLHYDPLTGRQRHGRPSVLARERMDFLLLLPGRVRVVIEVDGKQHYAQGDKAVPRLYGEMMAEDRRLRLRGYEVFRFGGFELSQPGAVDMLRDFFDELLARFAAN
jgi:very-short-patch-repair endonuclease